MRARVRGTAIFRLDGLYGGSARGPGRSLFPVSPALLADLVTKVERLGRPLDGRGSKHDLEEGRELEDSKIRNLRADLKKAQGQGRFIRWMLASMTVGAVVEGIRILLERVGR